MNGRGGNHALLWLLTLGRAYHFPAVTEAAVPTPTTTDTQLILIIASRYTHTIAAPALGATAEGREREAVRARVGPGGEGGRRVGQEARALHLLLRRVPAAAAQGTQGDLRQPRG